MPPSASSPPSNPALARLRAALAGHNTSPTDFGRHIWDHLEVVACEAVVEGRAFASDGAGESLGHLRGGDGVGVEALAEEQFQKGAKRKGRIVLEAVVQKTWLNPVGGLHGAATAYLVDVCTSLALMTISTSDFWPGLGGVSQNMAIHYAGPAFAGDRIRIECGTLNVGKMVSNMRCDITIAKTGALVATGVHTKVDVFSRTKARQDEAGKRVGFRSTSEPQGEGELKREAKL